MTTFKTGHISVAAIATTVPPVSKQVNFEGIGEVNIRHCLFDQTTSDLGFDAASRIIGTHDINLEEIGVLIFLSRTPDYRSPTTAAILQGRLNLSIDCICYDVNAGSNGMALGITLASSILKGINAVYGLIIVGDTPSKLYNPDVPWSTIESDAATAILLKKDPAATGITSSTRSFGHLFDEFSILKGGFRYYDKNIPFDATDKNNFKVNFDTASIAHFLSTEFVAFDQENTTEKAASEITIWDGGLSLYREPQSTLPANFILPWSTIQAYGHTYASSIALQLSILSHQEYALGGPTLLNLFSVGEGMSLWYISFEIDFSCVLATQECTEIFTDFSVTHEI